jgi:hypothetical protein
MSLKAEIINEIYNRIYGLETVELEFDTKEDFDYVKKELQRRVSETEKQMNELMDDATLENRIKVNWCNFNLTKIWDKENPRRVVFSLMTKEEVIKSLGFRIISNK